MIIDLADAEMLLSFSSEMSDLGYRFCAYNVEKVYNSENVEFFRSELDAQEYCLVMANDANHYQSLPIELLLDDLRALMRSAIDTSCNEAFDLTGYAQWEREKREIMENNLNGNIMNQKNLEFLADQIKYTGFGEALQPILKEQLEKGEKEFTVLHEANFEKSAFKCELSFKKSDQSDMYFFNSYKAMLSKEGAPHTLEQIFYMGKDNNFTMKEAFNLLEGRSVNKDLMTKEGEKYNSWISLDFKDAEPNGNFKMNHYHHNYGYNLEAALEKHSIKELQTPESRESLLGSLKKGNIQSVTFVVNGEEKRRFVEANPQFKTIRVYDESMLRINDRQSREQKQKDSKEDISKGEKKNADGQGDDDLGEKKEKKAKRRSQSI
ncbi:hypothetical protein [Flavobacterium tistrianum]|uniref:hypothetical protein n=1 Tax=Flavobacterium tistrianum TaxID=1685414 RepID=UPI000DAE8D27|nr:hypothetical protein [Flavobacterium tistrianum]KAF2342873.1 hypothetical protein DMB71_01350 [Flavobacterium tistrianum]